MPDDLITDRNAGLSIRKASLLWAVIVHNPVKAKDPDVASENENENEYEYAIALDLEIVCWTESSEIAEYIVKNLRANRGAMGIPAMGTGRMFGVREMAYPQALTMQSAFETCERLSIEWLKRAEQLKIQIDSL